MERGESRRSVKSRVRAGSLLVLAPVLVLCGCATDETLNTGASGQGIDAQRASSASEQEELARARTALMPLVAQQNERSARLSTFESRASR